MKKPIVLTIIDGLGFAHPGKGNAWSQANTPVLDQMMQQYSHTRLQAAGKAVGLPEGQIGNSEVGHLSIGAGEIVYTGLSLIQKAIDDGSFLKNKAFLNSINHVQKTGGTIHVMGLLSPGGVHSNQKHLFKIMQMLHKNDVKKASMHLFTDGRDVNPRSAKDFFTTLNDQVGKYNYPVASIAGRLYAMDRDQIFTKTEMAFNAICGQADHKFNGSLAGIKAYIDNQYAQNLTDEFIPCAVNEDPNVRFLSEGDAVIFFNFRPDRARQLTHWIVGSDLYKAQNQQLLANLQMTIMMPYDGIKNVDVAFDAMEVKTPLGLVLAEQGFKQLRIAETQKYAHVTFFMDGGKDIKYQNEERILVDSKKVDNFKTVPEMSAQGITDQLLANLSKFDVVIMNYANPDMVGHTGDLAAAIKAVEVTDQQIGQVAKAVEALGGTMFITADHGNAEIMLDAQGKPVTKHTTSEVPLIITDHSIKALHPGSLCNIAPTILDYMHLPAGSAMDHKSLISNK